MLNEAQNELILGKWWQLVAAAIAMATLVTAFSRCSPTRCAMRSIRSSKAAGVTDREAIDDGSAGQRAQPATCRSASTSDTTFEAVKGISFDIPQTARSRWSANRASGKSVTSLAILGLLPPENSIVDPAERDPSHGGRNLVDDCRSATCASCAAPTSR